LASGGAAGSQDEGGSLDTSVGTAGDANSDVSSASGGAAGSQDEGGAEAAMGTGGDAGGDASLEAGGSNGTGGDAGTGGFAGTDGSVGTGGSTGTGGSDGGKCPWGGTPDNTPPVKPAGDDLDLIDSGDTKWWVGTSNTGTYVPPRSPPPPTPTADGPRTVLHLTGKGLGANDYGTLDFSPTPGANGGEPTDMSGATGISFDAKGDPTNFWILIGTTDTNSRFCKCQTVDCDIGYRYQVTGISIGTWTTVTVKWSDFKLPTWVSHRPAFNAGGVVSISVGGLGFTTSFDVAIDNLKLTH
jgi:hypothetical protein